MKDEFIDYTLALRMKALGYDESCFGFYYKRQIELFESCKIEDRRNSKYIKDFCQEDECTAPTWQSAFAWFELEYDLQSSCIMFSNGKYDAGITRYKGTQSMWCNGPIYNSRHEAEIDSLEKLCEIVELKQKEDGTI